MSEKIRYSIVIPAHNEENLIATTAQHLINTFQKAAIEDYEIILVNDNSFDRTRQIVEDLAQKFKNIRVFHRSPPAGFGRAIRDGILAANGDAICIVMGDESDAPDDVLKLLLKVHEGYDVVYGNRFLPESQILDYPKIKFYVNRVANHLFRLMFRIRDKDISNAFKAYHRSVFEKIGTIQSTEFDITLELPIKAHLSGCNKVSVPVKWYGRKSDVSKFSLVRMSKPYIGTALRLFFISLLPNRLRQIALKPSK